MNYTLSNWGPERTPPAIKHLIIWTSFLAITSAFFQDLFNLIGIFPGPQDLFSLSWWGLHSGYFWEVLTFLFVQGPPGTGLTLQFFINLIFNMYILWVIGTQVVEIVGGWSFLSFYFITGIVSALLTLMLSSNIMIAGNSPVILALMAVWGMLYPESEVLLFFLIPIKAKWLISGLLGAVLLMSIGQGAFSYFLLYFLAICIGYLYATMVWGWSGPFSWMQPIDQFLYSISSWIRRHVSFRKKSGPQNPEKIIDINSKKPLQDDEAFVDAMLEKISRRGEDSLSWGEKKRLQSISEKKGSSHK